MVIDVNSVENNKTFEFDLCIIGAGAAGITISRELANTKLSIGLIEAGGFEPDQKGQELYKAKCIGLGYDLDVWRLRYFGGTTNHWNGWCQPLSPFDFEKKNWIPYSGWPITYDEFVPYYKRAQNVVELGSFEYGKEIFEQLGIKLFPFNPERLDVRFWRYSPPTRFGKKYREEVTNAENITVLLNGAVTELVPEGESYHIQSAKLRTLEGKEALVKAKTFILASGAVENARLLLLSNSKHPNGIGNEHDLVGRFFMEHPHIPCGRMNSTKTEEVLSVFFGKQLNGTMVRPGIVPSVKLQKEKRILNFSATCDPEPYSNAGKNALSMIKKKYDKRDFTGLTPELLNIVYDLDDIVFGGDSRKISETQNDIQFYARSEQSPNRDSRVYLSEERDALGMRKLILDWQLSEIDKRTLEVMIQQLGIEFGRLDLGRVYRFDWAEDGKLFDSMWGGGHHMGTTRMSDNDKTGVVDKNCRVYNSDNLFIAGSSVYPTVGCVNPTLTIVALAIRLTDNLKQHLN